MLLPNILVAVAIAAVGLWLGKRLKKYSLNLFRSIKLNQTLSNFLSNATASIFGLLIFVLILSVLNLDKTITSILAGAGVVGLAVGLAFQEPIVNTLSGISMSLRTHFRIGDFVSTNGIQGYIHQIDMRHTTLKTLDGLLIAMPNKMITEAPFTNYTINSSRRIMVSVGVGYDTPLQKTEDHLKQAISKEFGAYLLQDVDIFYTEFAESSITYEIYCWINPASLSILTLKSDLIKFIKQHLDEYGVDIPYPKRTLEINSESLNLASMY